MYCVPALGEHRDRDNAAHIAPGRDTLVDPFQAAVVILVGDLFIVLADQIRPVLGHLAAGPFGFAHGIEDKTQAAGLVLRAAFLNVFDHPRVDPHRDFLARLVAEPGRRLSVAAFAVGQPFVDRLRHPRVAADHDEHRRHRVLVLVFGESLPIPEALMPFLREQIDGGAGVGHHDLGRELGAVSVLLRLSCTQRQILK